MAEFLTSSFFRYFVFPLCSAGLGIAFKAFSRNDQYPAFKKEDIAIGIQLMLTACLSFVVITSDRAFTLITKNNDLAKVLAGSTIDQAAAVTLQRQAQELSNQIALSGWVIALLLVALVSVSFLIRRWGWKSETEMNATMGIGIPLAIGILSLVVVMAGAAK